MKLSSVKKTDNLKKQPYFKAGVTNFYSDFDGTFLQHKYRHDVFCRLDGIGPREEFLKNGKEPFQAYYSHFDDFIQTAKGKNKNKFNFTITTGRNRAEYNHILKRIKSDGLTIPVPDRLIVRNGADIYKKRNKTFDFFKSDADEPFLKEDFIQQKRRKVKCLSGGWDGNKVRKTIKEFFGGITVNDEASEDKIVVFEAETENSFYQHGMHFKEKLSQITPEPKHYAAIKNNGNLNFQIFLPEHLGNEKTLKKLEEELLKKFKKSAKAIHSGHSENQNKKFGQIMLSPKINGNSINKLFDTKAEVDKILKKRLNDLVIVAGDDGNDARMLNLFEYIKEGEKTYSFSADNLKKIYKLPLITIFVDNSEQKGKSAISSGTLNIPYDEIDNYFNSDGNVRFIHVLPGNNTGKPQNLSEAVELAIKEYAKRNKRYRNKLPKELREMIEKNTNSYPIDKSISENLEANLKVKLWNPINNSKAAKTGSKLNLTNKKIGILFLTVFALLAGIKTISNKMKNKKE